MYGGSAEYPLMVWDYIIAEEDTTICFPEITLATIPGLGGAGLIHERTGRHNAEMIIYTGGKLPAGLAKRAGLVDDVVPKGTGYQRAISLANEGSLPEQAERDVALQPSDFKPMKRLIKDGNNERHVVAPPAPLVIERLPALMDELEHAQSFDGRLQITRDAACGFCMTKDYQEARIAFLTYRMPIWKGE